MWTYAALADEAARIGNHLKKFCEPGDRVLLLMEDEPAYPAAIMGSMRAGFVPILTNTQSPADLIAFFLEDSSATAAIGSENFQSLLNDEMIEAFPCQIILSAQRRPWASESTLLFEYPTSRRDQAFWMYFIRFHRTAKGHHPSSRGRTLYGGDLRRKYLEASTRRHLFFNPENLLRLWLRELRIFSYEPWRCNRIAFWSSYAGARIRTNRQASSNRLVWAADYLYGFGV